MLQNALVPDMFQKVVPGRFCVADLDIVLDKLLTLAQDLGGTMEYVHGVGSKLSHLVPRELGYGLEIMRKIKLSIDPENIMNPNNLGI